MKKAMPVILIVLGMFEILTAVLDIKLPMIIPLTIGVIFIIYGAKILLDVRKKK